MGVEIERKFLVIGDGWRGLGSAVDIRQGYLSIDPDRTVRVRVADDRARLTVKGRSRGAIRSEFEYDIPVDDALEMLRTLCGNRIVEKHRHRIEVAGRLWELDEFTGANAGLVLVELEAPSEAELSLGVENRPAWVGRDVTEEWRLSNASLAERPWQSWPAAERAELLGSG